MPAQKTLPSWYTPDPAAAAPAPVANGAAPDWYQPEAQPDAAPAQNVDLGAVKNFLTGLARVPGAIASLPAVLAHTKHWVDAQVENAATGGNKTGADLDNANPVTRVLNKATNAVADAPFTLTGTKPYEPTSTGGKLGQAAVTGLGAGLADPMADLSMLKQAPTVGKAIMQLFKANAGNALRTGAASAAAEGAHEIAPNSDILPVAAALLTHSGTGLATDLATGGAGLGADALRQVVAPAQQGVREAGRALAREPLVSQGEAIAQPTPSDRAGARGAVRDTTDDLGEGLEDWQAGSALRSSLQGRVEALDKAREGATTPLREARDSSAALIDTAPVFDMISNKLRVAAGPQADAIRGARKDFALPDNTTRNDAESLAATRQAINARISSAKSAGDNASVSHLLDIRGALDQAVNKAVPEAEQYRSAYADASKPLDPTTYGPVAQTLDRDQFNSRYTLLDERVPDLFLRSKATRADMQQLLDAHGGDRQAAHSALEQHIIGKVQDAINPDGTIEPAAFDRAVKPYTKALSVWFPDLSRRFGSVKAAQATLDQTEAQHALAENIGSGALRDSDGTLTAKSFGSWLRANKDALATTQTPAAVMRLQAIHNALAGAPPGQLADVLKSELLPAATGLAAGGVETAVLGTLLHKSAQGAFASQDAARHAAFSQAIERAVLDPDYAKRLTAGMTKHAQRTATPLRSLVRSMMSTALETNAAKVPGQ